MLVATGVPELPFVDVRTNEVVARLGLPGPGRAVAISRDGERGFVAAGRDVLAVDVNARTEVARAALGPPEISDVELSPVGTTLYVVHGRRIAALDPATLVERYAIALNGDGTRMAIDQNGSQAAVVLASGRVAAVSLSRKVLLRHVKVPGAVGVAIDAGGRTLVSARGRLRTIAPAQRRPRKRALKLPDGAGGGLALSGGRSKLIVGPAPGGTSGAVIALRRGTVQRLAAGRGPGWPAWNPDSSRIYIANGGDASLSLVSPFTRGRIGTVLLPGAAPSDLVVQPGLAPLVGTEGADRITGTRGADRIAGLGGDDVLTGGRDRDSIDGGPGNDRLSGGALSDELVGAEGNDMLFGGTGNDRIFGSGGDDAADGGTGNDELDGELGNDVLDGGDGDDTISGGDGNDLIEEKGFGDDPLLTGGPGDDVIRGGRGNDKRIEGNEGNDQLFGGPGEELIIGGPGDDTMDGGTARDRLQGEGGQDFMRGDAAADRMFGGDGPDRMNGGSGADTMMGEEGNDEVIGGSGVDTVSGGFGDDSIRVADDSADNVDCGPGSDTVYVEIDTPTRDVLLNCELVVQVPAEPDGDAVTSNVIRGTPADDTLFGTAGVDSMFGRLGADRLFAVGGDDYVDGDAGNDELHGGPGDDVMAGRKGADAVFGDAGDDRITGDRGSDRLFGGPGRDTIFGNFDADRVDGGAGDDRINVVHGGHDVVVCGAGTDIVFADASDAVSKDCESVRR